MTRTEEQRLIRLAAAGDRDAAETFIRTHQKSLYMYILRLSGRPEVSEDVVQEAFVRVLTNLDRFNTRFRFSTWLFTIARRVYLNMCEKRRPASVSDMAGTWIGTGRRPDAVVADQEMNGVARDELQSGLMSLSMEQREILVLFHQHDWPIWLIAEHMNMPEGTIKSHLHRGRRRLREVLVERKSPVADAQEVWS